MFAIGSSRVRGLKARDCNDPMHGLACNCLNIIKMDADADANSPRVHEQEELWDGRASVVDGDRGDETGVRKVIGVGVGVGGSGNGGGSRGVQRKMRGDGGDERR
ncbi:hypothetical protein ACMFMG_003975 [Clarireedia jacksonii]